MVGPFGLHPKGTMRARALPAARALAARGHEVRVLMPPWHTPDEAARSWTDDGVAVEYVSLAGLSVPAAGHLAVGRRLASVALAPRPDIVHCFKPKAFSGLAAAMLRARQRMGASFALVVDTDDWEGPGGWNDLEPYGRAMRWFFALQERWGLRHTDAVTVASRALESLVWSMGVRREAVAYVPNALDDVMLDRVPPESNGADRDPTVLLYTRFFEFDVRRPVDVLEIVRRRVPRCRLDVVGKGLFGEERAFLEYAKARGLSDQVKYHGWLDPDAAETVFAGCDVALYPFDDTLVNRTKSPVKLLELLAAGLPVVAEAVGEPSHVVDDGKTGVLVSAGDTDAFGDAVASLLTDGARRANMAERARRAARDQHSWRHRVGDLERLYAAVARDRSR
jgi:glycosyltransferase involved in cell wall biosynthesis